MNERSWRHRGVIGERVADKKAAKKRFHVPATSLEALSAIRRRCQAMEALFSDFHVGDVGVGIVGGRRGRRFGHLMVLGICGLWAGWWYVAGVQEQKKAV